MPRAGRGPPAHCRAGPGPSSWPLLPPALLLQGLQLSLRAGSLPAPAAAAAQQKLQKLCREVIRMEAASSSTAAAAAAGGGGAACGGGGGGPGGDNPLRDALCGMGWDHAVRAPLVVVALQAMGALRGEAFAAEAVAMFPSLARLTCSNQQSVRGALHELLAGQQFRQLVDRAAVEAS
jgi:hypothetical protein